MSDLPPSNGTSGPRKAPPPVQASGKGHYSGANPIPTIQEFVQKLDVGKKDRDAKIDNKTAGRPSTGNEAAPEQGIGRTKTELSAEKGQKIVTDPVTGNEVVIENSKKEGLDEADNPKVMYFEIYRDTMACL
jgi:hypothetical protein